MDNEEQKKIVAMRIKGVRKELGMNQVEFADFLNIEDGQSTISKWERAKQIPGAEYTAKLSQKTGHSPLFFAGLDEIDNHEMSEGRTYPLVGEIQAGAWREPNENGHDDIEFIAIPSIMEVPPYNMKAFKVRGSSMDKIYPDGSIVFVAGLFDNHIRPQDGDVVMVSRENVNGQFETTLKELVIDTDGRQWLWPRSFDPEYQAPLAVDDNREQTTDVVILGVVQAAITKARRRK